MKSTDDIFKDEEPTAEAIQRMLATCDDSSEYIKENMIYCKKCHEPRRMWLSVFGEYSPVMCSCMIAERDRTEEEKKRRERLTQIEGYRNAGYPDKELQKCRFDHNDQKSKKASDMCRNYARRFEEFKKRAYLVWWSWNRKDFPCIMHCK